MARHTFGGDISAWAFTAGASNVASLAAGAQITFWTAQTGGTQITDLSTAADGSGPISSVTTGDGTTAPVGDIGVFYGPDNVTLMWASANAGARKIIFATDILSDAVTKAGDQTVTGTKTLTGGSGVSRMVIQAAAGQSADLVSAWSGADTGQGGASQRTFYLNEKGELRVIAAKTNPVAARIKGQPGQTAHVLEQTDTSNNPISWWDADGSWRAPNLGHSFTYTLTGNVAIFTGRFRYYNDTGVTLIIRAVRASVNTAPTGAAIRIDVNKNGTTIFTTQGNRPNIAIGTNTSKVTNMDVTTLADGDYLTIDIDAVGSTVAGADLLVRVLAY